MIVAIMEEVLRDQVRYLVKLMEVDRKAQEEMEDYEGCATLRDGIESLGQFSLGYKCYDEVSEAMLFWVQFYGEVIHAEEEFGVHYITYYTSEPHFNWTFAVDRATYFRAIDEIFEQEKRKRRRTK